MHDKDHEGEGVTFETSKKASNSGLSAFPTDDEEVARRTKKKKHPKPIPGDGPRSEQQVEARKSSKGKKVVSKADRPDRTTGTRGKASTSSKKRQAKDNAEAESRKPSKRCKKSRSGSEAQLGSEGEGEVPSEKPPKKFKVSLLSRQRKIALASIAKENKLLGPPAGRSAGTSTALPKISGEWRICFA